MRSPVKPVARGAKATALTGRSRLNPAGARNRSSTVQPLLTRHPGATVILHTLAGILNEVKDLQEMLRLRRSSIWRGCGFPDPRVAGFSGLRPVSEAAYRRAELRTSGRATGIVPRLLDVRVSQGSPGCHISLPVERAHCQRRDEQSTDAGQEEYQHERDEKHSDRPAG